MDGTRKSPILYFETNGSGSHEHVCADAPARDATRVQAWVDRERIMGRLNKDQQDVLDSLVEDLR